MSSDLLAIYQSNRFPVISLEEMKFAVKGLILLRPKRSAG